MDYGNWKPKDIRKLIREGKITGQTSGMCNGYAQANMAILPKSLAFDFLLFTQRNRKPCPLLDVTEAGNPEPKLAAPGADLRYDIPKYRIYKKGILTDEVTDLSGYWQDDYVAFLLGCSFSFESPMIEDGLTCATSLTTTTCPCISPTSPASPPVSSTAPWWYPCVP